MYINEVVNPRDLAHLLNIQYSYLTYILYHLRPEKCYISFDIPKKSGEKRTINAPIKQLKFIQRRISDNIWKYEKHLRQEKGIESKISHAFEKNKSILTNAYIHKHKRYVINIDLKDYFNSFHFGRVKGYFLHNQNYLLPDSVATIIAQLTCYNGYLPQGAPSSPVISNLISNIMDMKLLAIAKQFRLDYTRYADDLTFSTNDKKIVEKYDDFLDKVRMVIENSGFTINSDKTRLQYYSSQQVVTGLVVNNKININSQYYRETKAMAFSLYTKGEFFIGSVKGTKQQLEGRFAFINQIDKYNNIESNHKQSFRNLNSREEQYRRFLFFKIFFDNDKPLIVTEGKTDVVYIKAALKKLYSDYPDLVEFKNDSYSYKITFLKRSSLLEYLFGFNADGADSMKNLYSYFSGINKIKNYYQYFRNYSGRAPKCPVVFLFDNELNNKEKPLKNFITYAKIDQKQTNDFKKNNFILLLNDCNLFLATHPLVKNLDECEIEDLFDDTLLATKIEGKEFDRSGKKCSSKHYSKEVFSKYVMKNFKDISFEGFKPLLNTLRTIIVNYKRY